MASIVQDIQVIRSLRKDLRDPTLTANVIQSIESIHNCVKSGTDLNGWKKVDWRGSGVPHSGRPSSHGNHESKPFFGGRHGAGSDGFRDFGTNGHHTSSHSVFGHRTKTNFVGRVGSPSDPQVSIPLVNQGPGPGPGPAPASAAATPSTAVASTPSDASRHVPYGMSNKYVSKFKKNCEKVEDTILNTIILGKLNKFSEQNYDEIKEFITHIIDSGETDMIKCFMKLVFEKAASEEIFCPLYAKLLGQLSARYPILLSEMANLYSQYMEIFEEIPEGNAANYNEVCKRNVEKKYRRGYSQFLAELIKHDVIDIEVFMKTVTKIITQVELNRRVKEGIKLNEEFADCLMKIMKAIRDEKKPNEQGFIIYDDSDGETEDNKIRHIRQLLKGDVFQRISPLTQRNVENVGISNKTRFTLLDIYESIQKF
jgi:hypothetical protein